MINYGCYYKGSRKIIAALRKVIEKLLGPMDEQVGQRFFVNLSFMEVAFYCLVLKCRRLQWSR